MLGLSETAVKSRLTRGRALLREKLIGCCQFEFDRFGKVIDLHQRTPCACDDDIAILTDVKARLAATLLTAMIACFGLLANDRILLTGLSSHFNWSESALNLALIGVAWVVADSLARPRAPVRP